MSFDCAVTTYAAYVLDGKCFVCVGVEMSSCSCESQRLRSQERARDWAKRKLFANKALLNPSKGLSACTRAHKVQGDPDHLRERKPGALLHF